MPLLAGRVAIVTGGGRGVGRQHRFELARHGASVLVNDPGVGLGGEDATDTASGTRPTTWWPRSCPRVARRSSGAGTYGMRRLSATMSAGLPAPQGRGLS